MSQRLGFASVGPDPCLRVSFSLFSWGSSIQKASETLLQKVFSFQLSYFPVSLMSDAPGLRQYIRAASEQDLDRVLEIEQACFVDQWDYPQFRAALQDIFLVFEEEHIAGFITACYCELARKGIILRIAVEPSQQGKGIAKALLTEALNKLYGYNVTEIELSVDIIKTGAIKLYEKFGFKVMQVVSMDHDNANESFYMMKLTVN